MLVLATFDDAEEGALVDEQGWAETRRRRPRTSYKRCW